MATQLYLARTQILIVSFSLAPECIEAECWNRVVSDPFSRSSRRSYFLTGSFTCAAYFAKTDGQYTTIFQPISENRL